MSYLGEKMTTYDAMISGTGCGHGHTQLADAITCGQSQDALILGAGLVQASPGDLLLVQSFRGRDLVTPIHASEAGVRAIFEDLT